VTPGEVVGAAPELIVVCLPGQREGEARAALRRMSGEAWWQGLPAVRAGRVATLDGDLLHVPGLNLLDAFERLVDVVKGA
jgi:hypothetical protein